MTDQPQQVRVGAALSFVLVTNTGVSQGYVLSPVLFTICTSDCQAHGKDVLQIKFADETSLTGLVADSDETKYSEVVIELVDWCDEHFLELNVIKSEEMICRLPQGEGIGPSTDIIEDEEIVRKVVIYRYLGTIFVDQLC